MSSTTPAAPPDPPPDATPEEIEAHIQESRERLASTVDALTNKLDVKAQAKQKAQETSAQAKQKVQETSEQAKQKARETSERVAGRRSACLRAGAHHLASGVGRGSRRCCRARGGARRAAAALLQPKLSAGSPPRHLGLSEAAVIVMYYWALCSARGSRDVGGLHQERHPADRLDDPRLALQRLPGEEEQVERIPQTDPPDDEEDSVAEQVSARTRGRPARGTPRRAAARRRTGSTRCPVSEAPAARPARSRAAPALAAPRSTVEAPRAVSRQHHR